MLGKVIGESIWKLQGMELLVVILWSRKYGEKHEEEKKAYNQKYNQREVECEVCRCKVRKCNWLRHLETRKHKDGVENGEGGGDMDVDAGGARRRSWTVP